MIQQKHLISWLNKQKLTRPSSPLLKYVNITKKLRENTATAKYLKLYKKSPGRFDITSTSQLNVKSFHHSGNSPKISYPIDSSEYRPISILTIFRKSMKRIFWYRWIRIMEIISCQYINQAFKIAIVSSR